MKTGGPAWLFNCLLWLAAFSAGNAFAASASAEPFARRAEAALEEVWNNIASRNFEHNFDQRHRERIYQKYLAEARQAGNDLKLAEILNRMAREFGQSHIQALPPVSGPEQAALRATENNEALPPNTADVPADVGIIPCIAEGRLCVLRTVPGSPAEFAGVKPGDRLVSINGIKPDPAVKSYVPWDTMASMLLAGAPGSEVGLELVVGGGAQKTLRLQRRPNGFNWFKFGVMPRTFAAFHAEVLPGNFGYVYLTAFFPEQITAFAQNITGKLKDVRGLIIDLRNNVGGVIVLPQWLAGWSSPATIKMGKLRLREVTLTPSSYPQRACFKGPVAILVNEGTASAAEIFAAAMQDAKAAVLFGATTSGKCLPSQFLKLPASGFRLQTVSGDYERENGQRIEHIGVTPDYQVPLKLSDLEQGIDPVRAAAVRYLQQRLSGQ